MKPYTRSIVELFDGKKRYLIPLYQRRYAWKVSPQLELLWEDIERAATRLVNDRSSLSPHFMGALVISQLKTFGKQVQAFEVIDGQQRLTTFQLLLSALRDVASANGSRYAKELQNYLLNDGVMETPEIERFKLWPSQTDRRSFVAIIDPTAELDEIPTQSSDEGGYVAQATAAYTYFKQKIEAHVHGDDGYDEARLEKLFEALKEALAAVSIELEGGDDPQTIFETLNSRGVDLSQSDLMRNFIFQRAKGMGQVAGSLTVDKLYEKHWLPLDNVFWSQEASRGRQKRRRLDWMLTDHLSMHIGDLVSVESLFERYRRWVLNERPFASVQEELSSISATAAVEMRLFRQDRDDPLGDFGSFADAFDVSTAMPLVVYLASVPEMGAELGEALSVLQSYIMRRDTCGLTTKNYNRFFVGLVDRLRTADGNKVEALISFLSTRQSDIDRWPDDTEWQQAWLERDQYKGVRQPRLRLIFEKIEREKRSALNEDIEINSALTIEHIMPQQWQEFWPIRDLDKFGDSEFHPDRIARQSARSVAVNRLGNLTLLTGPLNSTVSNGPYEEKMPAIRAHSSLALNRDLGQFDTWNEETIAARGLSLFQFARQIWRAPERPEGMSPAQPKWADVIDAQNKKLPPDGAICRFTYGGRTYRGTVKDAVLTVEGLLDTFNSFSAASKAITKTSRNGWNDWSLQDGGGGWVLASDWRKQQQSA